MLVLLLLLVSLLPLEPLVCSVCILVRMHLVVVDVSPCVTRLCCALPRPAPLPCRSLGLGLRRRGCHLARWVPVARLIVAAVPSGELFGVPVAPRS